MNAARWALPAMMALAATSARAAPGGAVNLPIDRPTTVGGVEVACTGIGQTRTDPKWPAYPVRDRVLRRPQRVPRRGRDHRLCRP